MQKSGKYHFCTNEAAIIFRLKKNISRMLLQNEISLSFLVKDKLVNVRIRFAQIPALHVDRGFLLSK